MDIDGKKILRGAIAGRPLVTAVGTDQVLILDDTDGEPKRALASDLGGGLADIVDDTTPQLGGALDVNGQEITGAIDIHSSGDVILELGDQAGANKVSIRDSAGTEVLSMASDGAFNASTIDPSNGSLLVTLGDASGVDDFTVLNSGATLKFNVDSNGNVKALGKLDLGHSTDTTFTRVSAGLVSIEGDNIITAAATQTLTNKSIDSANNTITNIVNADIKSDAAIAASKLESITTTNGQLKLVSVQDSDALTENQLVAWDANGNLESQPVYVDGSGNVGIGTASPGETVTTVKTLTNNTYLAAQVLDDSNTQSAFLGVRRFGSGNSFGGVWFGTTVGDGNYTLLGDSSNTFFNAPSGGTMYFRINNSDKMVISSLGKVGIGTASPAAFLDVSGAGNVIALFESTNDHGQIVMNSPTGKNSGFIFRENGTDKFLFDYNSNITSGARLANTFELYSYTSAAPVIRVHESAGNTLNIDSTGNVGIGTTSPTALLEVQAAAGGPGEIALSTAELTVVATDVLGKVSFGAPLESSGTDAVLDGAAIWAVASDTFAADNNSTDLVFATAASETAAERMRIDSTGNVGIGTASPAEFMHVHASTGVTSAGLRTSFADATSYGEWNVYDDATYKGGLAIFGGSFATALWRDALVLTAATDNLGSFIFRTKTSTAYSERMVITNAGNVGIGTTSPAQALDVVGSIVASGVANQIPIYTEAHAASHTIDAAECYGGVHYVTAASVVITLPPVAVGMSVTIVSETANMVDINPDGTEVINLDGTAAAAGENINSPGAVGDICVLTYRAANTWYAATNSWVEATP